MSKLETLTLIAILCTFTSALSGTIYVVLHPTGGIDLSSPFFYITFISAIIGAVVCILGITMKVETDGKR